MTEPLPAAPAPAPEPTRRLFIGLMADPALREAVLAWRQRWQWPPGTALASPAHMHMTLHFLGEVAESRVGLLRQAIAAVPFEPLRLHLGQPEVWPRGIAVLRPAPDAALDRLQARLGAALRAIGFDAPECPWKPHLTLARKAVRARPPAEPLALDWPVHGFSLVWSRLPPQVPRATYEVLAHHGPTP